jgi:hypothetical protein
MSFAEAKTALPRISSLSRADKLQREQDNNQRSVRYARDRLGL